MQINQNIKLIRELSGKKQTEFAEVVGVKISNLKSYENTDIMPKANVRVAIAKIAGVSVDDLEKKKLTHEDVKFEWNRKDEKDVPTVTHGTSETGDQNIVQEFLKTTTQLIAGQNKLIDAHKDLTYSNTVLADTQKNLVHKLALNSDDSSETYSDEEIEAFLEKLGQKWEGRTVPTQIEFVTYAKKVLASIHFGERKEKDQKAAKAKHPVSKVR